MIFSGYRPGALASILKLHTDYYFEHWNFGLPFEAKVATELAEFLTRMDETKDLFLSAYSDIGQLQGSIIIDASEVDTEGAHLRWFIVSPECAGQGLGQELMSKAIAHCDELRFEKIYLTTFEGLDAARALYDRWGFKLQSEQSKDQWKGGVKEQKFICLLQP